MIPRNFLNKFFPEILVFAFAAFTRFFNLGYPKSYIFDEVYHAFTAQEMAKGNPAAWEWWNNPPKGFAYEWTHPPLAKEFMGLGIPLFGDGSFAWRFFSAFFGLGSIILIYFIVSHLFNRKAAIISALIASLDGLLLVMSRIAMNDSYFLFFSLLALFLFLKNRNFLMGLALGLAIASKWTGFFTIGIILILYFVQNLKALNIKKSLRFIFLAIVIPLIIYVASYTPFFLQKHIPPGENFNNFQTFIELQQQMWWYHTNLKATHPYQSRPEQWIFDLRPVWLYTDVKTNSIANIYTLDNPIIVWAGLVSVFLLILYTFKKFTFNNFFVVLGYLGFFVFWFHSPRIMFNYHYLASTIFLTIATGVVLEPLLRDKNLRYFVFAYLISAIILFVYFYPLWTGMHIPKEFSDSHFLLQSWK